MYIIKEFYTLKSNLLFTGIWFRPEETGFRINEKQTCNIWYFSFHKNSSFTVVILISNHRRA